MLQNLTRQLGRQRALAETQQFAALLPAAQGLLASLQQLWTADAACMQQIRPLSAATARPDPTAAATAAACRQQARWFARRAAKRTAAPHPDAIPANTVERFSEDEDEELGVLRLPDDPKQLAAINPQLARVVEMHWAMQERAPVLDAILTALQGVSPDGKRPLRVTKTAVGRLKVDTLRSLLEELGDDSRGNKEALVARLLRIAGAEDELARKQAAEVAAVQRQEGDKEGVVSRRKLAAQAAVAKRLAAAAERGGYGMPEASLREAHRQLAEAGEVGDYSRIFSPEEVADILAEARADDIAIIDVRGDCPFTDWMVLATARSQRLAHMLASGVLHALKARAREVAPGVAPTIEGALDDSEWMVVDAGSVVVHIFQGEEWRREYDLEGLWGRRRGANIRHIAPKKTVQTLDSLRE